MIKVIKAKSLNAPLGSMPIDPALIREGNLDPRGLVAAQSQDRLLSSGVWSCESGVFDFTYEWDEFSYIFEGEMEISDGSGEVHRIAAGDLVHFPRGAKTRWRILKPVRKVFFLKTVSPL
jgi:uncharacterized cupin superfamily protein